MKDYGYNSLKYKLALYHAPNFGNSSFHQLLILLNAFQLKLSDIFDKPSLLDDLSKQLTELSEQSKLTGKLKLTSNKITTLIHYLKQPAWDLVEQDLKWSEQSNNFLLTASDDNYPQLLKQQASFPMLLYIKGKPELLKNTQIAIVGSRSPTPTAMENAHQFAHYMAQQGMTITSGLAMGIDTAAHQGALSAQANTIAVAGTGIDRVYPAKNKDLAHQIVENGAIISEFPLSTGPLRQNFPKRNQIISGLSVGTLVVEAAIRSGSLITARLAMEQGREVFAIPGSIHNPLAKGCHHLIKQGAKLVEKAEDIIEELLPLSLTGSAMQDMQHIQQQLTIPLDIRVEEKNSIPSHLPKDQQQILACMDDTPTTIDQLQQRCLLSIDEVNSIIVLLDINGYINFLPGGKVVRILEPTQANPSK